MPGLFAGYNFQAIILSPKFLGIGLHYKACAFGTFLCHFKYKIGNLGKGHNIWIYMSIGQIISHFFKRSGVGCSESHHLLAERRVDEQVQIKSGSPNHEQVGWGT